MALAAQLISPTPANAPPATIVAEGLTKRFGEVAAVDDLSFRVQEGTVVGFLAPNGAGKTTTLRMVLGLARPTAGGATALGVPFTALPDPGHTVGANLELSGAHPGRSGRTTCAPSPCSPASPARGSRRC